jgi:hypothetical protein
MEGMGVSKSSNARGSRYRVCLVFFVCFLYSVPSCWTFPSSGLVSLHVVRMFLHLLSVVSFLCPSSLLLSVCCCCRMRFRDHHFSAKGTYKKVFLFVVRVPFSFWLFLLLLLLHLFPSPSNQALDSPPPRQEVVGLRAVDQGS